MVTWESMNFYLRLFIYCIFVASGGVVPIDNALMADPIITCGSDNIGISFNTQNPFHGNIYVKGRFNETYCRVNGDARQFLSMSVALAGPCGVRRRRTVTPINGITVDVTVVIMFHPVVLTKVDRAFNVQCFYMQAEKTVSADLDVSMLTTITITESVPMPACQYQVLADGPNGSPIRYAQIGQAVYHKWQCVGTDSTFCMTVHTCTVDDGQGTTVMLLDDLGCAQDRYLLQNLEYLTDTAAGQESHVFKFADKIHIFFSCQIRISVKEGDRCSRPQCSQPSRGKRSIYHLSTILSNNGSNNFWHQMNNETKSRTLADFDVTASKVMVLDIEDINEHAKESELAFFATPKSFCIDPLVVCVFSVLILALISTSLVTFLAWYKSKCKNNLHMDKL